MPLPVAHGLVGASLVAALHRKPTGRYFLPLLVGAILANAADFDFLLVFTLHSRAWHRGFSHSFIFAFMVGLIFVLFLGRRHLRKALAYGLAFASHGILDYVTTKEGGGVELLWPLSSERLIFGWVGLSELPSRLPVATIIKSLVVEFMLFTPLLMLVIGLRKHVSRDARAANDPS
ncbi:MAG TPA: metal-dependent hydrolase [Pyrinomonadaceae bacterium]|jgi:inner membrane protein